MYINRKYQIILNILGIVLAAIIVFPIYTLVVTSLKPFNEVFNMKLIPNFKTISFSNYIEVLKGRRIIPYALNSLIIAVTVTILGLFFHSMGGYALARLDFPGKKFIFRWILSTMMIPFAATLIPLFIIIRSLGLSNSMRGLIIPSLPSAFGIFMFKQFYNSLPKELEDSAKIDGSSFFGNYLRIGLPLSQSAIITLAVILFFANWNSYLWPLLITQKRELWTIQLAIANMKSEFHAFKTPWNLLLAASCMAALPPVILFFVFQKYLVESIKMTGLKA